MVSSSDAAPSPLLMTAPKAAKRLGVPWITFRRLMDSGEISYVQRVPNGTRWVEEDELRRWIRKHRVTVRASPDRRATATSRRQRASDATTAA